MSDNMGLKEAGVRGSVRNVSTNVGAIPGSAVHRYDATQLSLTDGNQVGTWEDQEGTASLSAIGAPTYEESGINGNPAVYYDGADDGHESADASLTQPDYIVGVIQLSSSNEERVFSRDQSEGQIINAGGGSNEWGYWAGDSFNRGSSADTNPHIIGAHFDGSNSELRLDGATDATGSVGANDLPGFRLACDYDDTAFSSFRAGEILLMQSPSTQDIEDAESYLANNWGISLV